MPHAKLAAFALLILVTALPAHVRLRSPLGGEHFTPGQAIAIEWMVHIQHSTVGWDLEYSVQGANGPWLPIAMGLPPGAVTAGSIHNYLWVAPLLTTPNLRVRVTQVNAGRNYQSASNSDIGLGTQFGPDLFSLSGTTGGTQALSLDLGSGYAGQTYLVAGSLTGTAPGISYGGFVIPLMADDYFLHTLSLPNQPPLTASSGSLDATGRATTWVTVPPIPTMLPPGGVTAYHAAAVLDGGGQLVLVTGPVPLQLLP